MEENPKSIAPHPVYPPPGLYKKKTSPSVVIYFQALTTPRRRRQNRRRRRRRTQRGRILPFLIPATILAAKAAAAGAISGGVSYGTKKAIEAATRKKRVAKTTPAQFAANKRSVRQRLNRLGMSEIAKLTVLQ